MDRHISGLTLSLLPFASLMAAVALEGIFYAIGCGIGEANSEKQEEAIMRWYLDNLKIR